jgi:hypothetical protein
METWTTFLLINTESDSDNSSNTVATSSMLTLYSLVLNKIVKNMDGLDHICSYELQNYPNLCDSISLVLDLVSTGTLNQAKYLNHRMNNSGYSNRLIYCSQTPDMLCIHSRTLSVTSKWSKNSA